MHLVAAAASGPLGPIVSSLTSISGQSSDIKTSILTILGVLVTIGIAYLIVKGLQK